MALFSERSEHYIAIIFFKSTEYQDNCAITVAKAYGLYRRSGGAFWMNSSDTSMANRLVNQIVISRVPKY